MCTNFLEKIRTWLYEQKNGNRKKKIHIFSKSYPQQFTTLSTSIKAINVKRIVGGSRVGWGRR